MRKGRSALLNKSGFDSVAAIACKVSTDGEGFIDGEIAISDCSRVINLDMSTWGYNNKQKRIKSNRRKIDTLIEVLTKFRKDYVKAIEAVEKGNK